MAKVTNKQATVGLLVVTAAATLAAFLLLRKAADTIPIDDYDGIDSGC